MCGIVGFVDLAERAGGPPALEDLQAMVVALRHRGPDASGCWTDQRAGVYLGHTRLSIIDLSPTGAQPMLTPDRQAVIVFNGEIYNFEELRSELTAAGVTFVGRSDTEVLLHALYMWGPARTLARLNGMFAFAYWDLRSRTLTLARDRMGEKPLYYGSLSGRFFFASELKALRAHPGFVAQINPEALAHFLRYNYVPAPNSIYRHVHKLPAGHWLSFDLASRSVDGPTAFWDLAHTVETELRRRNGQSPAEWLQATHDALRRSVKLRMVSDRPIGCFLSGGIDSSTVAALMQSLATRPIRTFTVGYREEGFNEADDAACVARHLGTDHTAFIVHSKDALEAIPYLPDIYDEPYADSSQIPTALLSKLTVQHVTVALTGDGGDEIFGGYNRHVWTHEVWDLLQLIPTGLRQAVARAIQRVSPERWDRILNGASRAAPRLLRLRTPGDKLHKMAGVALAANDADLYRRLSSICQDPGSLATTPVPVPPFELLRMPDVPLASEERMMYWDTLTYLPDDILVKVDRAAMHVGLEGRIPFLDNDVIALAWRMPLTEKIDGGLGKCVVRHVLGKHVPHELWDRPKAGFGIPVGTWLRTSLRDWAEDLFAEPRLAGCMRLEPIRQLWARHLEGRINADQQLWSVLMLSAWLRRWRM